MEGCSDAFQFVLDDEDVSDDEGDEDVSDAHVDDDTMDEAIQDQFLSDERVREMGLGRLLQNALSRPGKEVKCSLAAVECGRDRIMWERAVTGLHAVAYPSSETLVIIHTDREQDKLRGAKRNGAVQKLVVEMGSLWSAWLDAPTDGAARLHLALSSSPPCLLRMWTGNDNWVRMDHRRVLQDAATCNILVLHGERGKLESILALIRNASTTTKNVPVGVMSYRMPALVARAEKYLQEGQQKRLSSKGVGLFVRLSKAKTFLERRSLNEKCDALYRTNLKRWKLYVSVCARRVLRHNTASLVYHVIIRHFGTTRAALEGVSVMVNAITFAKNW